MQIGQPIWLFGLPFLLILMAWISLRSNHVRTEKLKQLIGTHLLSSLTRNFSRRRRHWKQILVLLAMGLIVIALARPKYGFHWVESKQKGIDLLFAVDTSRSMLAQDLNPNRLARSKLAVLDLVSHLQGDRVGIIAFAGTAFLQCPLTLDYDAFRQCLEALDTEIIPQGGTNLESAINEAERSLGEGDSNHKILIVITDGEDLEGRGLAAAKRAGEKGIRVFTIGVGSVEGELIPIQTENGGTDFVRDESGQPVKTRLDEVSLRQIAESTNAAYEPLGKQGEGLENLYDKYLSVIPKTEFESRMSRVYNERYQWPLAVALGLLVLEFIMGERRRVTSPGKKKGWGFPFRKRAACGLLMAGFFLTGNRVEAFTSQAEKSYQHGDYTHSVQDFERLVKKYPQDPRLRYNLGSAAFKAKDYDKARKAFEESLKKADPNQQQLSFYNLANTLYRIGEKTEKSKPEETIKHWEDALQNYQNALQLHADDQDAKYNYDYVKRKLEDLKKKNPPPENQKQPDSDKNDSSGNDSGKKGDDSKQPSSDDQKSKEDSNKGSSNGPEHQDPNGKDQKQNPPPQPPKKGEDPSPGGDGKKDPNKPPKPDQKGNGQSQKGEGKDPDQKPDSGDQPPPKGSPQQGANPPPRPGEMTPEEAENLLESLKSDEKRMPASAFQLENESQNTDAAIRNW